MNCLTVHLVYCESSVTISFFTAVKRRFHSCEKMILQLQKHVITAVKNI